MKQRREWTSYLSPALSVLPSACLSSFRSPWPISLIFPREATRRSSPLSSPFLVHLHLLCTLASRGLAIDASTLPLGNSCLIYPRRWALSRASSCLNEKTCPQCSRARTREGVTSSVVRKGGNVRILEGEDKRYTVDQKFQVCSKIWEFSLTSCCMINFYRLTIDIFTCNYSIIVYAVFFHSKESEYQSLC